MSQEFLAILAIVAASMLLLSVRVVLKKHGRFGAKHIGQSAEMRRRGISCVQGMDADMRRPGKHRISEHSKGQNNTINK